MSKTAHTCIDNGLVQNLLPAHMVRAGIVFGSEYLSNG